MYKLQKKTKTQMSMSFTKLKSQKNTFEKLQAEIEKQASKTNNKDDRFWYPEVDKAGNGSATIRFLPPSKVDGDDAKSFVKLMSYAFKGPTGQWYIENSPSTLGLPCPMMELNSKLWAEGKEDEVRAQSRKTTFISNVLVINDPSNPENNGKVFLFKYGKKIFDKIQACVKPEFPDDPKFDPYDFWTGANFKIKIKNVAGYRNYDSSVFDAPSELFKGDEEKLEKLWEKQYSLNDFLKPSEFKSKEELQKRLNLVMGTSNKNHLNHEDSEDDEPVAVTSNKRSNGRTKVSVKTEDDDDEPPFEPNVKSKPSKKEVVLDNTDDEDEDMDELIRKLNAD